MRFHALRMPDAGTPRPAYRLRFAPSRALNGFLAAAIAFSLLVAGSAALLHAAFASGLPAAISAVGAGVFLALALVALDVALLRFAPGRAERRN